MIRYVSTSKISAGKTIEAAQWALEQIEFVKKYDAIPPVLAFTNLFGDGGVITFTCDYKDMEQYAAAYNQATADPEYTQRINDAAHLFIEGSNNVVLMAAIEA